MLLCPQRSNFARVYVYRYKKEKWNIYMSGIYIRKKDGIKIGNQINIYMVLVLRPIPFFLETTTNLKQMSLKYIFGHSLSWTSLLAE